MRSPSTSSPQSIRERGVHAAAHRLRRVDSGYQIIAGERRWRARRRRGLHKVPRRRPRGDPRPRRSSSPSSRYVQRTDLNAIEEAIGYQRLVDEFGHKQETLAKLIRQEPGATWRTRCGSSTCRRHPRSVPTEAVCSPRPRNSSGVEGRRGRGGRDGDPQGALGPRDGTAFRRPARQGPRDRRKSTRRKHRARGERRHARPQCRRLSDRLGPRSSSTTNATKSGTLTIRLFLPRSARRHLARVLGEG